MTCPICKPGSVPKSKVCGAFAAGYTCHASVKEQWSAYRFRWEQGVSTDHAWVRPFANDDAPFVEAGHVAWVSGEKPAAFKRERFAPTQTLAIDLLWKKHCSELPGGDQ